MSDRTEEVALHLLIEGKVQAFNENRETYEGKTRPRLRFPLALTVVVALVVIAPIFGGDLMANKMCYGPRPDPAACHTRATTGGQQRSTGVTPDHGWSQVTVCTRASL